ncbi:hypothetical protein ACFWPK_24075 [Nocardia sp. NPDC058519]|uniref:hypothetical protein n=1 Tax=Nocardia sp. NPDC058519 TaxID=3346535 RepID=UPI003656E179
MSSADRYWMGATLVFPVFFCAVFALSFVVAALLTGVAGLSDAVAVPAGALVGALAVVPTAAVLARRGGALRGAALGVVVAGGLNLIVGIADGIWFG